MKKLLSTLTLFIGLSPLIAQEDSFAPVGTALAQFLEIGLDARAVSLGEACTASATGAGAVFWNPAGLVDGQKYGLHSSVSNWPADITLSGLVASWNLGRAGTIALSARSLITDDMEITTIAQPEGSGEYFAIANAAYGLTYARYLTDKVSVGITGKLISESYGDDGYSAIAWDIGTLYRTSFRNLKFGMSILHFSPDATFSGKYLDYSDSKSVGSNETKPFENYSLPINFRFGTSMDMMTTDTHSLIIAGDMVHSNNNLEEYNLGLEYALSNRYYLRSGYKTVTDAGGLTLGLGIVHRFANTLLLSIDYAFRDLGPLTSSSQFSLNLSFAQ
ncbi:MAG: PorV/PorQ family protein [Candidatus Marinimicrobia bacterium]|nr:PorV/PorQ family protein [Candidatus Neomarinimicrobiota bacterium]